MGVLRVELSEGISFEVNEQGYMSLKQDEDTQYETRLVADQISKEMKQLFPVSWEALVGERDE